MIGGLLSLWIGVEPLFRVADPFANGPRSLFDIGVVVFAVADFADLVTTDILSRDIYDRWREQYRETEQQRKQYRKFHSNSRF